MLKYIKISYIIFLSYNFMFKYYKKQFLSLLRSELIGMRNPETESWREIKEALSDSKIQKDELTKLMIKINSERTNDIINQSKEEVSKVLMASLSSWIKIDNKETNYSLRLISFIEKMNGNLKLEDKARNTITDNRWKELVILSFDGRITVRTPWDPIITDNSINPTTIIENDSSETKIENKDFIEANNWYKNSSKKPNYTSWDKEALKTKFWIIDISQWLNLEQFNQILAFQKENWLKWDWKIWNETLTKIVLSNHSVMEYWERKTIDYEKENTELNSLLGELIKKETLDINDFNNIKNDKWFLSYIRFNEDNFKILDYDRTDVIKDKQKILNSYNNTEINNKLLTVYNKLNINEKIRADWDFIDLEKFIKNKGLLKSDKDDSQITVSTNPQQIQDNIVSVESWSWSYDLTVTTTNEKWVVAKKLEEAWQSFDKTTQSFDKTSIMFRKMSEKIDNYIAQKPKPKKK